MILFIQDGWTALHLAAEEGKVDVVRLLTESQALVNIQNKVCVHICCHVCWNIYYAAAELCGQVVMK